MVCGCSILFTFASINQSLLVKFLQIWKKCLIYLLNSLSFGDMILLHVFSIYYDIIKNKSTIQDQIQQRNY